MRMIQNTTFLPSFLSVLVWGFALVTKVHALSDIDASRLETLEQRIASLEQQAKVQMQTIEGLMQRNLQSSDGCLPRRGPDNICVYDSDVEFLYHNANVVFDSSTVRFKGPIETVGAKDIFGKKTNQTTYKFSSQIILDSSDVVVKDSNLTFSAEHDYSAYEKNETQIPQHYGFIVMNNTSLELNSSNLVITGPDAKSVNRSLYDDLSYENLFSSVEFSNSNIAIEDSNTIFSSSLNTDESTVVFDHTKISNIYTDTTMSHTETSVSDSTVSYGEDTKVQWYGSSSRAYFTNGVDISVTDSKFHLDHSEMELSGSRGRFLSRVNTLVRGPETGSPIDFTVSRRVRMNYEQDSPMRILSDVLLEGSDVTVDSSGSLRVEGKFQSNQKAEFRGDVKLVNVDVNVDSDLIIDGQNGDSNARIEFREGIDVRVYNEMKIYDDLEVNGYVDAHSLYVSDEATIGGRLHCQRGATISGDSSSSDNDTSAYSSRLLKVEGGALVRRDLKVEGTLKTSNPLHFDGDVTITGNAKVHSLNVDSTASVSGTTSVGTINAHSGTINGQLSAGTIKAENDIFFDNLDVSGTATIASLNVHGNSKTNSLSVDSSATISGTATVGSIKASSGSITGQLAASTLKATGDMFVSGVTNTANLAVSSNADIQGTLNVGTFKPSTSEFVEIIVTGTAHVNTLSANAAMVRGTTSIGGATTVQTLDVQGSAGVRGNLDVDGSIGARTVSVVDNLSVRGSFESDVLACQDITVSGMASIASINVTKAIVNEIATIKRLNVEGDAEIGGDLNVFGDINNDVFIYQP